MKRCLLILSAAVLLASCQGSEGFFGGPQIDRRTQYRRVFMVYSAGYNNLSSSLQEDISDLCSGEVPDYNSGDVLLLMSHKVPAGFNYNSPDRGPVVVRIFGKNGKVYRDTLKQYSIDARACQTEVLTNFLGVCADAYPAESYGLLVSSHGTGWMPSGYVVEEDPSSFIVWSLRKERRRLLDASWTGDGIPLTKSLISHYTSQGGRTVNNDMDMEEFASCIPYKLDFIIFDACLMGGIETIYALKGKAHTVAAAPTEIMSDGFDYKHLCARIFRDGPADVEGAARDFFEQYRSSNCTVGVFEPDSVDNVAAACKVLADIYWQQFQTVKTDNVQGYNSYNLPDKYFFDLKDIFSACGADSAELAPLDRALDEITVYKAAKPTFLGTRIDSARFSGISVYLPRSYRPNLNNSYKQNAWNRAVGIVR